MGNIHVHLLLELHDDPICRNDHIFDIHLTDGILSF